MADFDDDLDEVKETRFAHLLKPIRDLAENFSIDLAHELEEYLEQLENATFSFEGAKSGLSIVDFAEAALLIQGSTCVYSKKVEYLFNLVYQALEAVKGKKQTVQGPDGQALDDVGTAQGGARARAAARDDDDDDDGIERFWDVEHLLKEAGDIDLGAGEGMLPGTSTNMRPPAVLLALEDHGNAAAATTGCKGDGDAGVYRLQQCYVHCSGALLLDARDGDFYDNALRYIGPAQGRSKSLDALVAAQRMEQPTQLMPLPLTQRHLPGAPQAQQAGPGPLGEEQQAAGDGISAGPMDVDVGQDWNDYEGGGEGGGDWHSDDGDGHGGEQPVAAAVDAPQSPGMTGAGLRRSERCAAGQEGRMDEDGAEEDAATEQEVFDPYKPLDPSAKGRIPDKPLVVRKPRKLRRKPLPTATRERVAANNTALAAAAGLLLPEFCYCLPFLKPGRAMMEAQQKHGHQATEQGCKADRQRAGLRTAHAAAPVFDAKDAAAAVALDEGAAEDEPLAAQLDDGDDGGGFDGGNGVDGGWSDAEGDENARGGPADALRDWDQLEGDGDGAAARWDRLAVPAMGPLGVTEAGMMVEGEEATYEELCRAHMESLLTAAAAREVQSDLSRRVNNWRQRIDPLLQAEETRSQFDIQDYGERILGRLENLQLDDGGGKDDAVQKDQPPPARQTIPDPKSDAGRIAFSAIAAEPHAYEVSRMFSAMLQLINNRNVVIHKADASGIPEDEVPDEPFALELLSTDMYHKSMGEKLAVPQAFEADENANGMDAEENRGTQPKGKHAGGRGKGGGAKRAKKAAAPLVDANMDDD